MPRNARAARSLVILGACAALLTAGCSSPGQGPDAEESAPVGATGGTDAATRGTTAISGAVLAAQAARDLSTEMGTPAEVQCLGDVTLDVDYAGEAVCESRYDDYPWEPILVIVKDFDPATTSFRTIFGNAPAEG